ncbi:MAG: hypothetical protein IJG46_09070 [Prevotella sp.]|nr:hypothetical protein [Prevotella sp.]
MKKFYTTLLLALVAMTASAQEQNDTTYVMLDFNQNPWSYPVRTVTKGWAPDYKDWDSPGGLLEDKDFSWPIAEGSSKKVKVTVTPVDLNFYEKISVYAAYELNEAEAASLHINAGLTKMLYTQPSTTMRFEAPAGYKFGKLVFYNYRTSNFIVGDEYDEEHQYIYDKTPFTQKLKFWTPASPHKNTYGNQMWDGDEKNILFNNPDFSAVFVKVDMRLVPDGSSGISNLQTTKKESNTMTTLDGRTVNKSEGLRKGVYIVDGKKVVVK